MSYCVNCGVELDASSRECPLCNTPVLNPKELNSQVWQKMAGHNTGEARTPFPEEKGQVETVKRKDFGVLLSTVILASAITCGILHFLVFADSAWSLAVIGACVLLWVLMIPVVIYTKLSAYLALLLDGAAAVIYLYMLTFLTGSSRWFWGLGLPIAVLVTAVTEALTLCIRMLPRSFLTVALYLFTAVGLLCVGLELMIGYYLAEKIALRWSAVVLTVCVILDMALITMLSRRRLRNEVRRRLHF